MDETITKAVRCLQEGKVIVYPTDTIYGLGADATNPDAIMQLYELKGRQHSAPFSVCLLDSTWIKKYVDDYTPVAQKIVQKFLPGRLTIVLKRGHLPRELNYFSDTVGIRIPNNPIVFKLLELFGKPITATSANLAGQKIFGKVEEIKKVFQKKVSLYVDGGEVDPADISTVIDCTGKEPVLIREGSIPFDDILAAIG